MSRKLILGKIQFGCAHIYFRYDATSGCVGDNVVEPGDIQNMDVGVEILFLAVLCMYLCMYVCIKIYVRAAAYSLDCHEGAMINCRL